MKARILKSMVVDGRKVLAGDIMEVKGWLHAKKLASNRYIEFIEEPVTTEEKVETKPKVSKKKDTE